jgi:hypothetical protein
MACKAAESAAASAAETAGAEARSDARARAEKNGRREVRYRSLSALYRKEMADHVTSKRFIIILILVAVLTIASVYGAVTGITAAIRNASGSESRNFNCGVAPGRISGSEDRFSNISDALPAVSTICLNRATPNPCTYVSASIESRSFESIPFTWKQELLLYNVKE